MSDSPARVLHDAKVLTADGLRPVDVVLRDGTVAELREPDASPPLGEVWDLQGRIVRPGLVDVHTHGGWGIDFNQASSAEYARAHDHYAAGGVTRLLVTLVPGPRDEMLDALRRGAEACRTHAGFCGIHLEGPFFAASRRGALPSAGIHPYSEELVAALLDASQGWLRVLTFAPEAIPLPDQRRLTQRGVHLSIGHTDCDDVTARAAIDAGVRRATHLCNAMPPLHHRRPGPIAPLLTDDRVRVEVIADGQHLADPMLELILRAKGPAGVMAVSDSMALAGAAPGEVSFGGTAVRSDEVRAVHEDGTLAGAVMPLWSALRRTQAALGLTTEAVRDLGTTVAAADLGRPELGAIAPGRRADLIIVGEQDAPLAVLRDGERVDDGGGGGGDNSGPWLPEPLRRLS